MSGIPADGVQTPDEWCSQFSVTVHGPDGWRRDGKSWDEPITETEFWARVAVSSCEMPVRGAMSADVSRVPGKTRVWQCVFCDTNNRLDATACRNCDATPATSYDTSRITVDMVERGVRALTEPTGEVYSVQASDKASAKQAVLQVLSAALAGYTVVRLPAPAGGADEGCTVWELDNEVEDQVDEVHAFVEDSQPYVTFMLTDTNPDQAERLAGVLLAAAREARRLAGGSQVGGQHGE